MLRWQINITTAPRKQSTLLDTIKSLGEAGFVPGPDCQYCIFNDDPYHHELAPEIEEHGFIDVRMFNTKQGPWRNWRRSLHALSASSADLMMLCQDDIKVRPNMRFYLEHVINPEAAAAYSAYTSGKDAQQKGGHAFGNWYRNGTGWHHCGALCYVLSRGAVDYLDAKLPDEVPNNKHIDAHVGKLLKSDILVPLLMHMPSLVQHTGDGNSTMGYGKDAWLRMGHRFTEEPIQIEQGE
jgi:hypothetical protein